MSQRFPSNRNEITRPAGETIATGIAVIIDADGRVYHYDITNPDHYGKLCGVSRQAALKGNLLDVCVSGELTEAGSGWRAGDMYYVGSGGVLQVEVPATGTPCVIAVGTAADTILVKNMAPVSAGNPSAPGGTYEFTQMIPQATWNVSHGLGYYPSVTVVDSAGSQVVGDVNYTDRNNLTITFSAGFAGKAYLS